MTREEIAGAMFKAVDYDASSRLTREAQNTIALFEIAYQLAVMNEREAEKSK